MTDGPGDDSFAGTITPDGSSVILYGTLDGETGVHAYDTATGTSQVVLPATVFGARDIDTSADGQRIVLTQGTTSGADRSVWLLDQPNGKFVQLSVNADYKPGNGASYAPTISADGDTVSFVSEATNLSPDDADAAPSAYVVTLP